MGHGDHQNVTFNLGADIEGIQHLHHLIGRYIGVQYAVYMVPVNVYHPLGYISGANVDVAAYDSACAKLCHQLYCTINGKLSIYRLHALDVARCGIGNVMQLTGSVADIAALEHCALKEYCLGVIGYLGVFAAHYAGNANALCGISYQQNVRRNSPLLAVQSLYNFTFLATADNYLPIGYAGKVKGMHGLAVLYHNVVGNIHDVIDGPEANAAKLSLHPCGRRSDLYVLYHTADIPGAKVGIHYLH